MDERIKIDSFSLDNGSKAYRGIHNQAAILTGRASEKAHLASTSEFRAHLSSYSIESKTILQANERPWNPNAVGGIPLDYDDNKKIVYTDISDTHTMIIGATGSKKSRLIVMPSVYTLAAARESIIICDPKAEIYKRTAKMLADNKYEINVINLREPEVGDGWNVLSIPYNYYISGSIDKACEFVNDLTVNLIPIQDKDPYWDFSSRDLLFGLILLLFQLVKEKELDSTMVNIASVLRLKADLFVSTSSLTIKRSSLWKFIEAHDLIRTRLLGIVICPSDTMSCILSVFDQHMSCFRLQPHLVEMMSTSTLSLDSIGQKPRAVFMIMPDEKSTYHKIVVVMIKQIYEYLIGAAYTTSQDSMFPVRINFLLDEFSSLPAIADFPQMIAASRSRNIRFTIVVQSKHQLKQRYGEEAETIQSNCGNWTFLFSRELGLLNELSQLVGNKDNSPLLSISMLQHLDKEKGECLVFCGRQYPYISKLADISLFDREEYTFLPMRERQAVKNASLPSIAELFPPTSNTEQAVNYEKN